MFIHPVDPTQNQQIKQITSQQLLQVHHQQIRGHRDRRIGL